MLSSMETAFIIMGLIVITFVASLIIMYVALED